MGIEIQVTCPQCHRDNHARYNAPSHESLIYCPHCRMAYGVVADRDLLDASDAVKRMLLSMQRMGEGDGVQRVSIYT